MASNSCDCNTLFLTLIASCHMNGIEPEGYLREVLCLLNDWPRHRILELAPCNWKQTSQQEDTKRRLEDHTFRSIMIDIEEILHRHLG